MALARTSTVLVILGYSARNAAVPRYPAYAPDEGSPQMCMDELLESPFLERLRFVCR
jgi:hypothetical protein